MTREKSEDKPIKHRNTLAEEYNNAMELRVTKALKEEDAMGEVAGFANCEAFKSYVYTYIIASMCIYIYTYGLLI